jgi:hypothetical protein
VFPFSKAGKRGIGAPCVAVTQERDAAQLPSKFFVAGMAVASWKLMNSRLPVLASNIPATKVIEPVFPATFRRWLSFDSNKIGDSLEFSRLALRTKASRQLAKIQIW